MLAQEFHAVARDGEPDEAPASCLSNIHTFIKEQVGQILQRRFINLLASELYAH